MRQRSKTYNKWLKRRQKSKTCNIIKCDKSEKKKRRKKHLSDFMFIGSHRVLVMSAHCFSANEFCGHYTRTQGCATAFSSGIVFPWPAIKRRLRHTQALSAHTPKTFVECSFQQSKLTFHESPFCFVI